MAEKKERERFSIKFNSKDKSHRIVIELLEEQPPRCKAQFIVNAVLHYINCPETPDISLAQSVDKEVHTDNRIGNTETAGNRTEKRKDYGGTSTTED